MPIVENAIIMAAGMSKRFVPLSYEMPKGLLRVKGEVLIERQIKQLRESGIDDITVVAGYMKEKFCYLKEKYGVSIVINDDYYRYNNTSTLMCVLDKLSSTYICSSDNYFTENVFEKEVPQAYYAAVYSEGETDEWCLDIEKDGRITGVTVGGKDAWYMLGQAYFSPTFSAKFKEILCREYQNQQTKTELWEKLYARYIDELEMYVKKYEAGKILEFDSLDELRKFDEKYMYHSDSETMQFIAKTLSCGEGEITGIEPLADDGRCNRFQFFCKGKRFIYIKEEKRIEQAAFLHNF